MNHVNTDVIHEFQTLKAREANKPLFPQTNDSAPSDRTSYPQCPKTFPGNLFAKKRGYPHRHRQRGYPLDQTTVSRPRDWEKESTVIPTRFNCVLLLIMMTTLPFASAVT